MASTISSLHAKLDSSHSTAKLPSSILHNALKRQLHIFLRRNVQMLKVSLPFCVIYSCIFNHMELCAANIVLITIHSRKTETFIRKNNQKCDIEEFFFLKTDDIFRSKPLICKVSV